MLQPLLPIKLKKEDPAYQTVEELVKVLEHAIKNEDIRNIALTGPYGSGKSSIIHTLMDDYKQFHYLPISLATLQANNEGEEKGNNEQDTKKDEQSESLNRKIEYSILQQIIYREKAETVPNSRFKRIIHIEKDLLQYYSINGVLLILAFIVIFLPTIAEKLYSFLWLYQFRSLIVFFATFYFLWTVYKIFMYIIKSYSNSKLNKLNLKDAQIEIAEENSIFNKHLDEILYFFQMTSYNVVVIEDLDRFETEKIYLKLRELNQLVNESKIVGRHIVFLYAIKDDVFEDEARTKFFDYITTVIPVINPSNSKDKLKEALIKMEFEDGEIPDDDLSEIAFFIQDMRILTNIANEYSQYRKKLYDTEKNHLNLTKLLAMIVYKNYYPKDFSQLHRREGLIYNCISSKPQFVEKALTTLDEKQKALEEKEKLIEDNEHLKVSDIRYLFLQELRESINNSMISINIDNNWHTLKEISKDESLFEKLYSLTSISYQYYTPRYGNYTQSSNINLDVINKKMNFEERLTAIKAKGRIIQKEKKELQKERLKIHRQKLSFLIKNYNLGETDLYKKIKLEPLMDVFIRQGYIDEEYYDYISYFYPGMVSATDRDLLLSIKRQIKKSYTYHIDKIDNFVKELKDYMFEHDAILNNELLDYLARKKNPTEHNMFTQMMSRLERADAPLDFLAQYYQYGKQQKEVFTEFINWNDDRSWQLIEEHSNNEEKQLLREGWLKYCNVTTKTQTQWLNTNYSFLSSKVGNIGLQKCKELMKNCFFAKLDDNNSDLLSEVIKQCHYVINKENLCFIANFLNKGNDVNPDNLNLTRITETNHPEFEEYIKASFVKAFTCFSSTCKDESVSNILYILNHEDLTPDQKVSYLTQQQNRIDDFSDIEEEYWDIVIKSKVINPTWENIDSYYSYYRKNEGLTAELSNYIEYYHSELEGECSDDVESKFNLFKDLLGTSTLGIEAYSSLCKAFDSQFDDYKGLKQLGEERLQILLADNKIAFSDGNTELLQATSVYPNYLIHYSREFLENINDTYNIDTNCAFILLSSEKFSIQEKRQIVDIISLQIMLNSQELADKIIDILLASNNISVGQDFLNGLLQTARNEKNRVQLLVQMLSDYSYNNDEISSLLSLLGGKYKEIADREKHPILENNEWNVTLLTKLKEISFISSTKPDKDGIRVHPKRN